MGAWTEQQARDRLMDRFIKRDPLQIVLHRPTTTTSAAGGLVTTGSDTLTAQEFFVYPFKRRLTIEYRFNPQSYGEDRVDYITYVLIFRRGADIQEGDTFDPSVDVSPATDRLESGLYTVSFISARAWDRGQAGLLYRG